MEILTYLWRLLPLWSATGDPTDLKETLPTKPNIVFILADDLGWNDVSWTNPSIQMPNLDLLAKEGVILHSAYSQQTCTPSRAALLTGIYPYRLGMQHGSLEKFRPYGLPLNTTLLPEELRKIGYQTHIVGKWHLGYCKWEYTPTYRGFDSFHGFYTGYIDYYTHKTGKEKGLDFRHNTDVWRKARGQYSTNLFAAQASQIIKRHDVKKPLFLYLPFQNPHLPNQAPKKFLNMYSAMRNEARRIHAAKISALDKAVGSVLRSLMKKDMLDNTLIVFTSDNGASASYGGSNWPLRGAKSTLWEGGTRVPTFIWGKMLQHSQHAANGLLHIVDWYPTILSLAGGTPAPGLDGVDQTAMLLQGASSARTEFVYNINEVNGRSALREGRYKLIEGSPGGYNSWYYIPAFETSTRPSKLDSEDDLFTNTTSLYDLEADPSETFNIAWRFPEVVSRMRAKLAAYQSKLVTANGSRKSRKANPKFHDGVWSPGWC